MQKVEVLRAACCVAGCDGETNEAELVVIGKLAAEVGVGRASLQAMIARGTRDPDFHNEQFRVLKDDAQTSMAALLEVAMADGSIGSQETLVLRELSKKLEIPPAVFDQLMSNVSQILGEAS